jgi:hypothetical protein
VAAFNWNPARLPLESVAALRWNTHSDALQDNMARFWNIQDRLLYIKENFADGWFERRHVGSHAALEAAQRMCSARTGVDLAREYQ